MSRVFNFSAGPAALPEVVLQQARDELLDWHGAGMSVMEMSHRGKQFMSIAEQTETDLRDLLNVPENYKVLFLQGGATTQFSMIPMNLLRDGSRADYFNTGAWSKKAIAHAKPFCDVHIVASSEANNFCEVPDVTGWDLSDDAAYVHYTANETIGGVEFQDIPDTGEVPLVSDMSSTLLSRPLDVSRFGLIYAGAQKNIGPAGLTLVIVREDLLGQAHSLTPVVFDYKVQAEAGSMNNTPPTFAWYLTGLVCKWLKQQGGLTAMARTNAQKAKILYEAIDQSDFYHNPVAIRSRSWMNVPFTLSDAALDPVFLKEAEAASLTTLKGHRSVGGMRASIYNAMPLEGVKALVEFMQDFERRYG